MAFVPALVKILRSLETSPSDTRMARALFVAQACAFRTPLNPAMTGEAQLEAQLAQLKAVLGEINEFIAVDVRLAQELFIRLLRARLALLMGIDNAGLLKAVLAQEEVRTLLPEKAVAAQQYLLSTPRAFDFLPSLPAMPAVGESGEQ